MPWALLVLAALLPVAALLFPLFGLPSAASSLTVSLLVAGVPEGLCLTAAALLGGRTTERSVSRLRYYCGLSAAILNGVPMALYAYVPHLMPGGSTKLLILAGSDLGFLYSVLLMGGEFQQKFRRLFIWEGGTETKADR